MRPPVIAENSIRSENTGVPIIREIMVATTMTMRSPYGEKTRPGPCPEPELIALRTLMINQARQRFCKWRFPASLIYVLIVSPSPAVPSTVMPLPSRNTSAGRPVVLDTALLPCSFLPPSAKVAVLKYSAPFAAEQLHSLTTSISRTLQSLRRFSKELNKPRARWTEEGIRRKIQKWLSGQFLGDVIRSQLESRDGPWRLPFDSDQAAVARLLGRRLA